MSIDVTIPQSFPFRVIRIRCMRLPSMTKASCSSGAASSALSTAGFMASSTEASGSTKVNEESRSGIMSSWR